MIVLDAVVLDERDAARARRLAVGARSLAGLLAAALATAPPAGGAMPQRTLVGEDLEGIVRPIDPDALPVADPRELGFHLVRPRGHGAPLPGPAGGNARIELANGDQLQGRVAGGEGEAFELEILGGARLLLHVEDLRGLVVPELVPERTEEPLGPPPEGDRLYRRTGDSLDRIDGTVVAFDDEGVRFDSLLGPKTFPWDEVAALYVEVLGGGGEDGSGRVPGPPVVVDLVDGSRLRGRLVSLGSEALSLAVATSDPLQLFWRNVAELAVDDGRLLFLSELAPAAEEGAGVPFDDDLGMRWPHRLDRAVTGDLLRVGGRTYTRGVGVHAPTRVVWRIGDTWDVVRGMVAIDDGSAYNAPTARGSVVFRVSVDGETLWESDVVRGGEGVRVMPEVVLPAAVGGKERELVLEADPVEDFRGDRGDWLRVVLVDRG